jgi:hypothetical protein
MNFATESAAVPAWAYGHSDWKYIRSVNKIFGKNKRLKGYPHFSLMDLFYYTVIKGIRVVSILNYINYNKSEVMDVLQNKLGWVYYGGKHYESIFTRFFHAFYLPNKFGYDLRKSYLSALICSGQITRDEALDELKNPPAKEEMLVNDKEYVMKKLGLSAEEFESIVKATNKTFNDYPNTDGLWTRYSKIIRIARNYITRVG